MSAWQIPSGPYRLTPHFISHRARPEQALRFILDTVEAEGGESLFIFYGRWAKRIAGKACASLPADHEGQIIMIDARSESPTAAGRKARKEARLHVRHVDGPDRQPRSEDPHQRALDSLNRPRPPEQEPPDQQPGT